MRRVDVRSGSGLAGWWRNLASRFARNAVAKNTSVLMMAQLASRILGVVYLAALARYVGAEGLGMISTASVLNGLLVLIVAPGLDILMVRDVAPDTRKASSYVSSMLFIRALLSIPFVVLTVMVARVAGYQADTIVIIRIYTVVYLLDVLGGVLSPAFRAFERMEYEAISQIVRDGLNIVLSLMAIYLGWSLVAISLMSVVAQGSKLILMAVLLNRRFVRIPLSVNLGLSWTLMLSSLPFGAFFAINAIQSQLGTFVLSIYRSPAEVGLYSAATLLVGTILLLANSFSSSIFPALSSLHASNSPELKRYYQLCYKYLLIVGFPLAVGIILVGDRTIALIYGDRFDGSTTVIRILAVFLFTLAGYSNGPFLMATGRQGFFMWTQGVAAVANALLLLALVPPFGATGAAIAFVLPGIGTFFVHSNACHRPFGLSLPWATMGRILLATLFMAVSYLVSYWAGASWLIAALLVAPAGYTVALLALGAVDMGELRVLARGSRAGELESERIWAQHATATRGIGE